MSDSFVRIPGIDEYGSVHVDNTEITTSVGNVQRQRVETYPGNAVGFDASGRQRISLLTTLFDGKVVREEDAQLWDTDGTGAATFSDGKINMVCDAGEWLVRQSRQYMPYFSGKSQQVEISFDTFAIDSGCTKRIGYFSSSAVSPHTASQDGWYIESNGTTNTYYLVVMRSGTEVLRKVWTEWDGYEEVKNYNWDNFTVILSDFLWLGGAVLNVYMKSPDGGFYKLHSLNYAGTSPDVFIRSPSQPVRYEIRGAGSMRPICSQVASEGSLNEAGEGRILFHSTILPCNAVGTIYALKGAKKLAAFRDIPIRIDRFSCAMSTPTADVGLLMLLLNPTLSAPLSYSTNGKVSDATATNQTVSNVGRVIAAAHVNASGVSTGGVANSLQWMGMQIDDTPDEIVLAYLSLTATQSVNGAIHLVEY
jgi:hypothetical protein